jgi:transcriptional regulator with XRE-family HTH domain
MADEIRSSEGKRGQLLSKSMEKTFHRYQSRPGARHAFTEAEAAAHLAHQIRVLRTQRGWTQRDLAKQLGTTQAAVSRLEDADYGRISFKTMVALANAFDVAPVLKFVSTIDLMRERWVIRREEMEVPSFSEEAETVAFVEPAPRPYPISSTAVAAPGVAGTFSLHLNFEAARSGPIGSVGAVRTMTTAAR